MSAEGRSATEGRRVASAFLAVAVVFTLAALLVASLGLPVSQLPSPTTVPENLGAPGMPTPVSGALPPRAPHSPDWEYGDPSEPQDVVATPHDGGVNLSWNPPEDSGYGPVVNYTVAWWADNQSVYNRTLNASSNHTWVKPLQNGALYYFVVAAGNPYGESNFSEPVSVRPGTPPDAVVLISVSAGNTTLAATWQAPNTTEGYPVLNYQVRTSSNGSVDFFNVSGNTTQWTGGGFVDGQTYRISIRASNALGFGPSSASSPAEPAGLPSAPRNFTSEWVGGTNRLVLIWNPPGYLGGVSLTNYTLAWSSSDGRSLQTHLSPQVTSYALPASPPGTVFTLSLQANNMAGSGTPVTLSVTFPGPLPTNALVGFFGSPLGVTVILVLVGLASALTGYSLSVRRTRRRRGGPAG